MYLEAPSCCLWAQGHRSQALETQQGLFKIGQAKFQVDGGQ